MAYAGLDVVFVLLYFSILPGLTGATVGKYATGIRVVDSDGRIANLGKSLLRWASSRSTVRSACSCAVC